MIRRVWNFLLRNPELFAVFILFLLTLPFKFPHMADDYPFLHSALKPGIYNFLGYDVQMTRNPLLYLIMIPTFKSGLFEYGFLPMYFYFFLYACGASLAIRGLLRDCEQEATAKRLMMATILGLLPLLLLNPNQAEVFYFAICMPYSVGAFALGVLCYYRSPIVKVFAMVAAFALLETFFFPALMLLCLPHLLTFRQGRLEWKIEIPSLYRPIGLWLVALVITVINRKVLTLFFPTFHYTLGLDPATMATQSWSIISMLASSFFYRTNYIATIFEAAGILILLYSLFSKRLLTARSFGLILLALFVCEIHVLVMSYSAMRAHYGAIFMRTLFLGILLAMMLRNENRKRLKIASLLLISLSYFTQSIYIFSIKDNNYHALQKTNLELIAQMDQCQGPCTIKIAEVDRGTRRDWVLLRSFWPIYLDWVRNKYRPTKTEVNFVIEESQALKASY